jgi:hypothetical protein
VSVDGIFHVYHVNAVRAIADDAESASAGSGEDAGNEMRISDAPN